MKPATLPTPPDPNTQALQARSVSPSRPVVRVRSGLTAGYGRWDGEYKDG